jgi:uncharacterized protein YlxP (DUF503 family)
LHVGVCTLTLRLPENHSLKGKRRVVSSLCARVRNRFNVSIAEVDDNDTWQRAVVGIAVVANDQRFAKQVLSKIVDYVENDREVVLDDYRMSFS